MQSDNDAQEDLNRTDGDSRLSSVADFLSFLLEAKKTLGSDLVSADNPDVRAIRDVLEEHYVDDRGEPAMYQSLESSLYDDAREIVTLLNFFGRLGCGYLLSFHQI